MFNGVMPDHHSALYQSRRVWMGGQRAEETVSGMLEVANFDTAIKGAKDVRIKGTGSKEPIVR